MHEAERCDITFCFAPRELARRAIRRHPSWDPMVFHISRHITQHACQMEELIIRDT
jgi:hypothetical protein